MNKRTALLILGCTTWGMQSAMADSCAFSATRSATIDNEATRVVIGRVVIGAGAGALTVQGDKTRKSVEARGRACASTQELLDQIQIETRRDGDTLYVRTVFPESDAYRIAINRQTTLDLTVAVPDSVAIDLEDSSGDLQLRGVRTAQVADGSGDVDIRDIRGDVAVTDSSGDILIDAVGGNLRVQDSSGDIDILNVNGSVEIPVDSSGGMLLRRVAGGVHITNDSSGDIVIAQVQRDVTIDTDSSGNISVEEVGGNFNVGADSSGDIHQAKVLGKVQLPRDRR